MAQRQTDLDSVPQLTICFLWDHRKWFLFSELQFPHLQRRVCHEDELKKMYVKHQEKVA